MLDIKQKYLAQGAEKSYLDQQYESPVHPVDVGHLLPWFCLQISKKQQ